MTPNIKYIIVSQMGTETPILFFKSIDHDRFLQCIPKDRIVSAGFVTLSVSEGETTIDVSTEGLSKALGLKSRPQDVDIIDHFVNGR